MKIYLAAIIGFWVLTNSSVATALSAGSPPVEIMRRHGRKAVPRKSLRRQHSQPAPRRTLRNLPRRLRPKKPGPKRLALRTAPRNNRPRLRSRRRPVQPRSLSRRHRLKSQSPPLNPLPENTAEGSTSRPSPRRRGKRWCRNGGTADPAVQLAPGVSNEQASRQRQSTTQLLATTDTNLKQLPPAS